MRRFVTFGPAFVVLLTAVVTLVAAPAAVRRLGQANTLATVRVAQAALDQEDVLERINEAVRNIARTVEPSVVHVAWDVRGMRGWRQGLAQGSGWVFDDRGHVVTNAHVVRDAPRLVVQFYDGRTVGAEVVALDQTTDVAVIRVESTDGLVPARRATGIELQQGDRVYAFGSPFGFKFSMSEGIVSGLGRDPRSVIGQNGYTNFIQSDAAVNPGNSGGPLVDIRGRVVGMNVAIATGMDPEGSAGGSGQSSGISFAIPLDTIESVAAQLISEGVVAKGFLGVDLPRSDEINRRYLDQLGYRGLGVVVPDVIEGGPADAAGIRPLDVLTHVRGRPVTGVAVVRSLITLNRPGDKVDVRVWREGETIDLNIELVDRAQLTARVDAVGNALPAFGLMLLSESERGVVIEAVRAESDAAKAGFRPRQVLVKVNKTEVASGKDLIDALAEGGFLEGRKITATVDEYDGRRRQFVMQYRP